MLGGLIRALLVIVVLVAAVAFFLGYRIQQTPAAGEASRPVGTAGIDTGRARDVGAKIGETAADAAHTLSEAAEDGTLTSKIKAKMALDDHVKALAIDVDTRDGIVTLSGRVASDSERQRAVALAAETAGVKRVVDQLEVR
jgi:hypothetical protein